MSARSVGVDVGGTFTDLVSIAPDGAVEARKVLSTPEDQSVGVETALTALGHADVDRIVHGTTVATNALLERAGARVVLCATDGFTDVLRLRRQNRAALYDLSVHHPDPLVAPDDVVAVRERIAPEGVLVELTGTECERVEQLVAAKQPQVVAIALLHAYRDPSHERVLAEALRHAIPDAEIVLSSDVFPEIREYERTATTSAEAYLRPKVALYLSNLAARIRALELPAPGVMTSSGGMRSADDASRSAARLALSGPAGGVVGAAAVVRAARQAHETLSLDRVLTVDIGGTSADVGLVLDGEPLVEPGGEIAGVPISLPRVLVETVSAGGGSIGWVDDGGALRVGPRSAGSVPGPAAFGQGGAHATVTDAHVMLGHIAAARLSGRVTLDVDAARQAIDALATRLEDTPDRVAHAMIAIADAEMARALRRVSVERGVDPRSCVLMPFGGGGPLHACGLADRLGVPRILVPPFAGVLSAVGLALTSERREGMVSVMRATPTLGAADIDDLRARLTASVSAPKGWRRASILRMRYVGQGHELDVPLLDGDDAPQIESRFRDLHRRRIGFALDRASEVVSSRHVAWGEAREPRFTGEPGREIVEGPRSIPLSDATLLVRTGWRATPSPIGGWLLERIA